MTKDAAIEAIRKTMRSIENDVDALDVLQVLLKDLSLKMEDKGLDVSARHVLDASKIIARVKGANGRRQMVEAGLVP